MVTKEEQTKHTNIPSRDSIKRKHVTRAREAVEAARHLSLVCTEQRGFRYYVAKHQSFRDAIIVLWGMGYWTDQIARFIGNDVTEQIVLHALRGHLAQRQQLLLGFLINHGAENAVTH